MKSPEKRRLLRAFIGTSPRQNLFVNCNGKDVLITTEINSGRRGRKILFATRPPAQVSQPERSRRLMSKMRRGMQRSKTRQLWYASVDQYRQKVVGILEPRHRAIALN